MHSVSLPNFCNVGEEEEEAENNFECKINKSTHNLNNISSFHKCHLHFSVAHLKQLHDSHSESKSLFYLFLAAHFVLVSFNR